MMSPRRFPIWALMVLVTSTAGSVRAVGQEKTPHRAAVAESAPQDHPEEFAEFLALTEKLESSDVRLWDALVKVPFVVNSDSDPNFRFEFFMFGPPKRTADEMVRAFIRVLLESQNPHAAMLLIGNENLPSAGFLSGHVFTLREKGRWEFTKRSRWGFVVDGSTVEDSHFIKAPSKDAQRDWIVEFDSSSFLKRFTDDTDIQDLVVQWDSVTRTLVTRKRNGTMVRVRFHSPNDELRYGTSVAEIWVRGSNSAIVCLRAFDRSKESMIEFPIPAGARVAEKLNATEMSGKSGNWAPATVDTPETRDAAKKLWKVMTGWKPDSRGVLTARDFEYKSLSLYDRAAVLTNLAGGIFRDTADDSVDFDPENLLAHALAPRVLEQLRDMRAAVEKDLKPDSCFTDDSTMVYRKLEAIFGPSVPGILYANAAGRLLHVSRLKSEMRVALADAMADWGHLPHLSASNILEKPREDLFIDAVFRSGWQWPCEEKHLRACQEALKSSTAGGETERVAVETLIRLNAAASVPKERFERWFQSEIVNADEKPRHRNLCVLTQQPSGVDVLLQRIGDRVDSDAVRAAALRVLTARASATLATSRFDFLPEKRCQKILALSGRSR